MLLEMHCHTSEHSACSHISAVEIVQQVFEKHLQGIVITDHHYLWTERELKTLRRAAGVPDYFLILSGQEVSTFDYGDVLVYGVNEILEKGTPLKIIRERFHYAALVWAHPYRNNKKPSEKELLNPLLDGIEIFNSNHKVRDNSRGLRDWHTYKFTAIGGTDTHGFDYAGMYPTLFDHPVSTISELADELRQGRCRPFIKEIPKAGANAQVTEVTIGTKGYDEVRQKFIIRKIKKEKKWESAEWAFQVMKELSRHGFDHGTYRVPQTIDEDPESMTIIEQGLRGKSFYEKIQAANYEDGQKYIKLAAQWLAKLHNLKLCLSPVEDFMQKEEERLKGYLERFTSTHHPYTSKARQIVEEVLILIQRLFNEHSDSFVQGHGDYHPKNIIIGQDKTEDRDTLFVSAIDFEGSYCLPRAFDAGYFLSQFNYQLSTHKEIISRYSEDIFIKAYVEASTELDYDFYYQVELFRAHANMSIASYLLKLGLSETKELWHLLTDAERALTACCMHHTDLLFTS
jgi:thiamine kinase-like enzyme